MSLTLITPAVGEPVSLTTLKAHLRVTHDADDQLITDMAAAAAAQIERVAGLSLLPQTFEWRPRRISTRLTFPRRPVTAVSEVALRDEAGLWQPRSSDDWQFVWGLWPSLALAPSLADRAACLDQGLRISFAAGFANAAALPNTLQQAICLLTAHYYERREPVETTRLYPVPASVAALIAPFREVVL